MSHTSQTSDEAGSSIVHWEHAHQYASVAPDAVSRRKRASHTESLGKQRISFSPEGLEVIFWSNNPRLHRKSTNGAVSKSSSGIIGQPDMDLVRMQRISFSPEAPTGTPFPFFRSYTTSLSPYFMIIPLGLSLGKTATQRPCSFFTQVESKITSICHCG